MNKKAITGDTFTWLASIFIIFVIMVIYIAFMFGLGAKKVYFERDEIRLSDGNPIDKAYIESFHSFLETEIDINNRRQDVIDAVLSNLDVYFETKSFYPAVGSMIDRYGINKINDISSVSGEQMLDDGFDRDAVIKIGRDNEVLGNALKKELDRYCDEYLLLIPQGLINENGFLASSTILGGEIFLNTEENLVKWTPTIVHKLKYRGQGIEIKYRQRADC
jgi:hypothetical protein